MVKNTIYSNLNSSCRNLLDMRNLQEQLFWPFTFWINWSSDLKIFANPRPSASNFKIFSWSLEQFFLTVGQNNFGNKIPLMLKCLKLRRKKEDFWQIIIFYRGQFTSPDEITACRILENLTEVFGFPKSLTSITPFMVQTKAELIDYSGGYGT